MAVIEIGRRRIFLFIAAIAAVGLFFNLLFFSEGDDLDKTVSRIPTPGRPSTAPPYTPVSSHVPTFPGENEVVPPAPPNPSEFPDSHPISGLMKEADQRWRVYEGSRSTTFKQTVETYRSRYGRHPPPGFTEWYKFARKKNVFNIDDFDQIMDDLRPFWAIGAKDIRTYAAHMWEDESVGGIHIRDHKVVQVNNVMWRTDTMVELINRFIEHLPDMDIAMNRMDQPRVIVPWNDMQDLLAKEYETRVLPPQAIDTFTKPDGGLLDLALTSKDEDNTTRLDPHWFDRPGQQYMDIASLACPPESPARNPNTSITSVNSVYKEPLAGLIANFNLSSDLCTIGPTIQHQHGLLYSASSIRASHTLVPIFGECKVNVNSDILFPANMYYKHDPRYDYSDAEDAPWEQKTDNLIWRGVTSGGVQVVDNWQTMHRQRLVLLLNGTYMAQEGKDDNITVLSQRQRQRSLDPSETPYEPTSFHPSTFASAHTDVGFVESWGCVPDCSFYDNVFSWKPQTTLTSQFKSKYLIDVDGHSFSGRWHAFLQSRSLGFKATIFREWHDSRLFAWRHFVPVDNRYDDLYSLLTYFIGTGSRTDGPREMLDDFENGEAELNAGVYMPSHDLEARRIARQSRDWANKVLRRDDIEVYMFRLLLEYARICDDHRDNIGYSGDGSELDRFDEGTDGAALWGIGGWLKKWGGKKEKAEDTRWND